MASIRRIEGQSGPSYHITVSSGRDASGKQIRHYMTWRPDHPMSHRQMEKAAQKAAFEFERQIDSGYQLDSRQTFDAYAAYVLDLKARSGRAATTLDNYRNLLRRVSPHIGHLKLSEIRPQHLNLLYKSLAAEPMGPPRMLPNQRLIELVRSVPKQQLIRDAKLNTQTVNKLWNGTAILLSTAQRVASYWQVEPKELFTPYHDKRTCPPEYIRSVHACISIIFAQAEKEMLIAYDPASKASPPKPYESRTICLEPEHLTCILNALEQEPLKWKTLLHVMMVTGCRRGEILSMKWSNLDVGNQRILLNSGVTYCKSQGLADSPTKTRTARYVTLPSETMALLEQYRCCQREQIRSRDLQPADPDLIFPSDTGKLMSPTSVNAWLTRFCSRHNLPHIHPHAFRHTAASIMIANGVDIVTVSKMLGHKRPSMTTDVYSHMIARAQNNATETIAQVILRSQAPLQKGS